MAIYSLGTGPDTIPGTTGDDTVNATSATLNPGDSLTGDAGTDTLALFGGGTYRIDQLASFTGFENLTVNNQSGAAADIYVGDAALAVTMSGNQGNVLHFGAGAVSVQNNGYASIYAGSGNLTFTAADNTNNQMYLGSGATTIQTGTGYSNFNITGGSGAVTFNSNSNGYSQATFTLGSGVTTFHGAGGGDNYIYSNSASAWNAANSFDAPAGAYLRLALYGASYDLTGNSFSNVDLLYAQNSNQTLTINSAVAAGIQQFYGNGSNVLTTSDATLDLSHTFVSGFTVTSTNTTGTTFTVADINTAYQIVGGTGNDTIVASGFTFTQAQLDYIFATQPSIEVLTDSGGSHTAPPSDASHLRLTTGADAYAGTIGADIVYASAATLNPTDHLDAGGGIDTLALFGGGTFRIDQLASFTGFDNLTLNNQSNTAADIFVGDAALSVTMSGSQGNALHFGAGAVSVQNNGYTVVYGESGGLTFSAADNTTNQLYLGSGATTIQTGTGYSNFNITGGSGAVTFNSSSNGYSQATFTLGSGATTFHGSGGGENYIYSYSASAWNAANSFDAPAGAYLRLALYGASYDLTGNSFSNVDVLDTSAQTLTINSTVAAGIQQFYGNGSNALTTSDATLDLTHSTISGLTVTSTNATGTIFTVGSINTAYQIAGGTGNDTIVASGFTFTQAQLDYIFATQPSIEVLTDSGGSHTAPPSDASHLRLTTGADAYAGTIGADIVYASAATLNPTDHLDVGGGTDTLALFGGGTFRIDQLASFTGFENLTLNNQSNTGADIYIGDASLAVTMSSGQNNALHLGAGTVSVQNNGSSVIYGGSGGLTLTAADGAYNQLSLGSGATAIQAGTGGTFYITGGSGAVTFNGGAGNYIPQFYLGSGATTFHGGNGGDFTINSNSASAWNAANSFDAPAGAYLRLALYGASYDLTGNSFSNIDYIYTYAQTLTINSTVAANVQQFSSDGNNNVLTTSDATLDLSHTSVSGFTVTSTNATGTIFTVANINTAYQIAGGTGNDTIVASGFTFTQQQKDVLFANGSVEHLQDSGGVYSTPYPAVEAFLTSDTGPSSIDRITKNAAISGTGDANAIVTIRVDNVAAGTVTADGTGHWSYTPTGLADGAHSISASESNNGGYTRISTVNFTLDTSLPATTIGLATDTGASPTDRITKTATITGTTQANATVSLVIDNAAPVVVTANGSGVWTYTPSGLSQGDHTIVATATDPADNTGAASSLTFTYDTTPPPVVIGLLSDTGTPGDLLTNSAALTGTTQPFVSVSLVIDNGSPVTVTADANGVWSYTPSNLSQGSHTVSATATDPAGNIGNAATLTFTYDSIAPGALAAPMLAHDTGPSGSDLITRNPLISYPTATAGNVLLYKLDNGSYSTTAPTFASDGTADGLHTVYLAQRDAAGNIGTASSLTFTLDTSVADALVGPSYPPPGLTAYAPTGNSGRAGGQVRTYTIDPTKTDALFFGPEPGAAMDGTVDSASERLTFQGTSGATASWTGTTTITLASGATQTVYTRFTATVLNDTASPWAPASHTNISTGAQEVVALGQSGTFQLRLEYSASYTYSATGAGYQAFLDFYDGQQTPSNAGQKAVTSTSGDFYWNPLTDTSVVTGPASLTNSATANFSFSSNETGVSYMASLDGGSYVAVNATTSFSGLADGAHTLDVRAVDADGYSDLTPTHYAWTVDTVAPVVTSALVNDTSGGGSVTRDAALTGTAEPNSLVYLTIDGNAPVMVSTNSSGVWTYSPTGFADGSHTVDVTQTDTAGNTGTATTLTFTLDTTIPTVSIALVNDTSGSGVTNNYAIVGSADPDSSVTLIIDGDTANPVVVLTDNLGGWSYVPCSLADGSHSIDASQTDAAGNTGTATTLTFILDTVAPTVTSALAQDTGTNGDGITTDATISGTAEANSTVYLTIDNDAAIRVNTDSSGVWTYAPAGLANGQHTVDVTQTDTAGNTGAAATLTFTYDATAPVTANAIATQSVDEDTAWSYQIPANTFDDTDGDALSYSATLGDGNALPSWLHFDAATQTFSGTPPQDFNGQLSLIVTASDGAFDTASTFTLNVNAVNDAPVVTGAGNSLGYTEIGTAVTIAPTLALGDVDNTTLTGATVTIAGFVAGDVLGFANQNGINGSYNSATGVLTLSGTASLAAYQTALSSVTFASLSHDPTAGGTSLSRTIAWQVTDGTDVSVTTTAAQTTIAVTAVNDGPVNSIGHALTSTSGTNLTLVGLSVADPDAVTLTTTLHVDHGTLKVGTVGGVSIGGNGSTTVTLTGSAAQINAALAAIDNVVYRSDRYFTGSDRLTMTTSDGGGTGSGGVQSDTDNVAINVVGRPLHFDVNADGRGDLFFANDSNHGLAVWTINGGQVTASPQIGTVNAADGWHIAGTGDFNGDHNGDLLFFNDVTNGVAIWQMNGTNVVANPQIGTAPAGSHIAAIGDFDRDGKSDVLFINDTTHVATVWKMDGITGHSSAQIGTINAAAGWHFETTGDFNGDGKTDLLFLNDTTHGVAVWQMDGTTVTANPQIGTVNAAAGWHFETTGDFNGDGKTDLLFLNGTNNGVAVWQLDGTTVTASPQIGTVNAAAGWHFETTGDFNGDGKTDLLFLNDTTHGVAIWQMDGTTVTANPQIGFAPAGSHFAGLGDYNADGKTDLLFENDTSHVLTTWQMNGLQIAQTNQLGTVNHPADWHLLG